MITKTKSIPDIGKSGPTYYKFSKIDLKMHWENAICQKSGIKFTNFLHIGFVINAKTAGWLLREGNQQNHDIWNSMLDMTDHKHF